MKIRNLMPLLAIIAVSCQSDDGEPMQAVDAKSAILVANEGAYNGQSAELAIIYRDSMEIRQNAYAQANDDMVLGDVLNSIYNFENELYLVVNNSSKIEVIDAEIFEQKRTISGLDSPRFMHFISSQKAYVSDLFANGIHIINPSTGTYEGFIDVGFWIEEMLLQNGEIWASNPGGDKIVFIDPVSDLVTGEMGLSEGASGLVSDADGNVWVLCQGTFSAPIIEPMLFKIDGNSKAVLSAFSFPDGTGYGGTLKISGDGGTLYFLLANDLYDMEISAAALPSNAIIEGGSRNLYGVSINAQTGEIALTDAVDFSQGGRVYFYNPDGTAIDDYPTGIAPKEVLWLE